MGELRHDFEMGGERIVAYSLEGEVLVREKKQVKSCNLASQMWIHTDPWTLPCICPWPIIDECGLGLMQGRVGWAGFGLMDLNKFPFSIHPWKGPQFYLYL